MTGPVEQRDWHEIANLFAKDTPAATTPSALPMLGGTGNGSAYARTAVDSECAALAGMGIDSGRNEACNIAAFNLGQLVGQGLLDENEVRWRLLEAMRANRYLETDGERAARATIESGLQAGKANPRGSAGAPTYGPGASLAVVQPPATTDNWITAQILTRAQLDNLPQPEPLIVNTLDRRTVALLAGPYGSGKSFVGLSWGCAIATGNRWLGREVPAAASGPVLLIAAEGAHGLPQRVDAYEWAWRGETGNKVDALEILPTAINLLDEQHMRRVEEHVAGRGYALVIIDTYARCLIGGDENSAKDAGFAVAALDQIMRATDGGSVLLVHHTGKVREAGARGSSALAGAMDTIYELDGAPGQRTMTLERTKRKDGSTPDKLDLELIPTRESCVVATTTQTIGRIATNAKRVLDVLSNDMSNTGASPTMLAEYLRMAPSSVQAALSSLLKAGLVGREQQGRGSTYRAKQAHSSNSSNSSNPTGRDSSNVQPPL